MTPLKEFERGANLSGAMRRIGLFLLVLAFACARAHAGYDKGLSVLAGKLKTGNWTERIRAVHQMGGIGEESIPALGEALDDPDWQVRLAAVHWLGRWGRPAGAYLEDHLEVEACPVVRLTAIHWLGAIGSPTKPAEDDIRGNLSACQSWFWPVEQASDLTRIRSSKIRAITKPDEQGCHYVRFHKPGKTLCPAGTLVRGVARAPTPVKFLKRQRRLAGIALCCPPDPRLAEDPTRFPQASQAECRTHPIECPSGWIQTELGKTASGKDKNYLRTSRHAKGDLNWVHCCRKVTLDLPDVEDEPPVEIEYSEEDEPEPESRLAAIPSDDDLPDLTPPPDFEDDSGLDDMPERVFALKALARLQKERKERNRLPKPSGIPGRQEPDVPAGPDYLGPERRAMELAKMPERRAREDLPRPEGIPGRTEPEPPGEPSPDYLNRDTTPPPPLDSSKYAIGKREDLPRAKGLPGREDEPISAPAVRYSPRTLAYLPPESPRADPKLGRRQSLGRPGGIPGRPGLRVRARPGIVEDSGARASPIHDPIPDLLVMIRSKDARKRSRAAEALGQMGLKAKRAVPALKKAIRDRSPRVRSSAALALGNTTRGSDTAVKLLRKALKDKHVDVRYSAAQALGRIGTPKSRKAFYKHMRAQANRLILD